MKNVYLSVIIAIYFLLNPIETFSQWEKVKGLYGSKTYSIAAKGSLVFTSTENGFYRSSDNGENWTKCKAGLPDNVLIYSIGITETTIYAVASSNRATNEFDLFISHDKGKTWSLKEKLYFLPYLHIFGTKIITSKSVINNPYGNVYLVNGQMWSSMDGKNFDKWDGSYWKRFLSFNEPISDITSSEGKIFYAMNGILKMTNDIFKKGIVVFKSDTQINKIVVVGQSIFLATSTSIYRSLNYGKTWSKIGPYDPNVKAIGISDSNIFALSNDFRIARTNDNDSTWIESNKGISDQSFEIDSMAFTGPNVFVKTTEYQYPNTRNIYHFINETGWEKIKLNIMGEEFGFSDKFCYLNNRLYCKKENAFRGDVILCSDDNGLTWYKSKDGLPNGEFVKTKAEGSNLIVVATNDYIYTSENKGITWNDCSYNLLPKNARNKYKGEGIRSLIITGNNLIATKGAGAYILRENTWNTLNEGLPYDVKVTKFINFDKNVFALTNHGVFRLLKNEKRWEEYNNGLPGFSLIKSLTASNKCLFALTTKGLYNSTNNGITWNSANNGLPFGTNPKSIVIGLEQIYLVTNNGIYKSNDNGSNWNFVEINLPKGDKVKTVSTNRNSVFVLTENGSFLMSENEGNSWIETTHLQSNTTFNATRDESISVFDNYLIAQKERKFFRSTNNGKSWSLLESKILTDWKGDINQATILSISDSIAITHVNDYVGDKGWFRLVNSGTNWLKIKGLESVREIYSIICSDRLVFALTSSGVFKSSDYGTSWYNVNLNLPTNEKIISLVSIGSNLFAATVSGVYSTTNNMKSWSFVGNSLPKEYLINDIATWGKYLYVGTKQGIWKRLISPESL